MMMLRTAFAVVLAGLAITASPVAAIIYHVGPAGSDAAPGSALQPFRTIQRGADAARAGDTVLIAPGIYRERAISIRNGGTAAAPVTFRAAGGGRSIIDHGLQVATWTEAGGQTWAGQAIFPAGEAAATSIVERVVIAGVSYRKALTAVPQARGDFTVDAAGRITVWPQDGATPAGRDVMVLAEKADSPSGIYVWDNGRGGSIANVVFDGLVHRAGNSAIWGARFGPAGTVNRNLTIRNCEIAFNWQYAVRLDNWIGATVQNCDVHENAQVNWPRGDYNRIWPHAIIGFNADRVNILGSKIHDNHGEGVGPFVGCSNWVIRGNEVYDNYSINIYIDTDEGNMIVDRNFSYITGKYQSVGRFGNLKLNYPDGIRIGNEQADLGGTDATPFVTNVFVTNNVVVGTGDGITSFPYNDDKGVLGPSGLENSVIANNTIVNTYTGPQTFRAGLVVSRGRNVTVMNNISFPQAIRLNALGAAPIAASGNLAAAAGDYDFGAGVTASRNLAGNPQFVTGTGFAAGNYRLGAGSIAIDRGVTRASIVTDFGGGVRPQGAGYDIGAFER